EGGVSAVLFYLAIYAFMNLAAFGVIVVRERETGFGDDIRAVQGLGRDRPELAWAITISMLALAGLPGTVGFIGKLYLIQEAVAADYTWLGVLIVIGSMISLAYYLRVVAWVWMRPAYHADPTPETPHRTLPAMAGGSPEAAPENVETATAAAPDEQRGPLLGGVRCPVIIGLTVLMAAATVFFGVLPSPLVDFVSSAGDALATAF